MQSAITSQPQTCMFLEPIFETTDFLFDFLNFLLLCITGKPEMYTGIVPLHK